MNFLAFHIQTWPYTLQIDLSNSSRLHADPTYVSKCLNAAAFSQGSVISAMLQINLHYVPWVLNILTSSTNLTLSHKELQTYLQ